VAFFRTRRNCICSCKLPPVRVPDSPIHAHKPRQTETEMQGVLSITCLGLSRCSCNLLLRSGLIGRLTVADWSIGRCYLFVIFITFSTLDSSSLVLTSTVARDSFWWSSTLAAYACRFHVIGCQDLIPVLQRDAMLARYVPWLCVCPSVCLSVTSRRSVKMAKRTITQTTPYDGPRL